MNINSNTQNRIEPLIEIVRAFFRKVDARDSSLLNLISENIEFFYPKFGVAYGKATFIAFFRMLSAYVPTVTHHIDDFKYIVSENTVVVEGTEHGTISTGKQWPDGLISHGRICIIFEFKGELIKRLYFYLDPDITSEDKERIKISYHPELMKK